MQVRHRAPPCSLLLLTQGHTCRPCTAARGMTGLPSQDPGLHPGPAGVQGACVHAAENAAQCSGLIWRKILNAHNFGASWSENPEHSALFRIAGQHLGSKPLENPDSLRISPFKILTGGLNGCQKYNNSEDRDTDAAPKLSAIGVAGRVQCSPLSLGRSRAQQQGLISCRWLGAHTPQQRTAHGHYRIVGSSRDPGREAPWPLACIRQLHSMHVCPPLTPLQCCIAPPK